MGQWAEHTGDEPDWQHQLQQLLLHNIPGNKGTVQRASYSWVLTLSTGCLETMVEGVSFSSRPSELTGSYMYEPDSQDPSEAGVVTVEILSGDAVIGSGSVELAEASSYTAFSVPVVYAGEKPLAHRSAS